ncbi:MAG: SGNH/GDSL hydrolase family protein, partial [Rheinheimera sp.]
DYANPLDYWALFPSNFVANIALCIEYIKSKNSDCEIFLITPPYRNIDGDTPSRMSAVLPFLKLISEHYSIPLVNSMQESGIGFKYMKANIKYSYDGIHFNALGNKLWGKYIARKILSGS